MWQSSNPALKADAFDQFYGRNAFGVERADVTTLAGVANKTAVLLGLAVASGVAGYWLFGVSTSALWISSIAAFVIVIGFGFILAGKPALSPILAPIYAVVEGAFLGALTHLADNIIAGSGLAVAMGGVGAQAGIITGSVLVSMVLLYKAGIVRPTKTFKAVIATATAGIMLAYLVSFILSLFWQPLPLLSFASAASATGWMGLLGLGVNVFILIIAALWLVIDFGEIEAKVEAGAPRYMEWYCGFALMVTLAWIYYEAVKLVVRLAFLFGDRD